MGIKKFAIGSLVASLVGVAFAQAPAEAAATATITGQFKTSVGSALVLTTNGTTYYAKPGANGKFTVKMPASKVANSTVQMVDPSGRYLGPIILGTTKVKAKYKAITGLKKVTSGTVSLGTIAMKTGYAISASKKAGGTNGVMAVDKSGKPKGAGNGGRVKSGGFAPVAVASIVRKMAATKCPDGSTRDTAISGTGAGQGCARFVQNQLKPTLVPILEPRQDLGVAMVQILHTGQQVVAQHGGHRDRHQQGCQRGDNEGDAQWHKQFSL